MVKLLIIALLISVSCFAQDSVLHFNTNTRNYLLHTVKPQWQDSLEYYHQDFYPVQLKDSTWFLNKENLKNKYFQGIISQVEQTIWFDSIKYEPINDTMYIGH